MSAVSPEDSTTLDDQDRSDWLRARIVELDEEIHDLDRKAAPISKAKREANKEMSRLLEELRFIGNGATLAEDDE